MLLPFKQVDAFSNIPFKGNPAAVFLLKEPLADNLMQQIASEMNLSETAFLVQKQDSHFSLRWFTPLAEVDLCGHATLASAFALWEDNIIPPGSELTFHTKSGELYASRTPDGWIRLDFPLEPENGTLSNEDKLKVIEGLKVQPVYVTRNRLDILVEVADESSLFALTPDFNKLQEIQARGIIVTCLSASKAEFDFISRCFYPAVGVNEDPVTGSAHCFLLDYWHRKLDTKTLTAYQASARGGLLKLALSPTNRVLLSGQAVTTVTGTLHL